MCQQHNLTSNFFLESSPLKKSWLCCYCSDFPPDHSALSPHTAHDTGTYLPPAPARNPPQTPVQCMEWWCLNSQRMQ